MQGSLQIVSRCRPYCCVSRELSIVDTAVASCQGNRDKRSIRLCVARAAVCWQKAHVCLQQLFELRILQGDFKSLRIVIFHFGGLCLDAAESIVGRRIACHLSGNAAACEFWLQIAALVQTAFALTRYHREGSSLLEERAAFHD